MIHPHTNTVVVMLALLIGASLAHSHAHAAVDLNWTQRGSAEPSTPRSSWLNDKQVEQLLVRRNNSVTRGTGAGRDPVRWLHDTPHMGDVALGELLDLGNRMDVKLTYERMAWVPVVQALYYERGRLSPGPQRRLGETGVIRTDRRYGGGSLHGSAGLVTRSGGSDPNIHVPPFVPIPEPAAVVLFAGLCSLGVLRRPRAHA